MVDLAIYRIPVDTSGMAAKRRYRLRQKLQASLFRLIEVIEELTAEEVQANETNLITADAVMRLLARFLHLDRQEEPLQVLAAAVEAIKQAAQTRAKETWKRKIRSRRRRS
jgi:maltooligosyltrehalose synthase